MGPNKPRTKNRGDSIPCLGTTVSTSGTVAPGVGASDRPAPLHPRARQLATSLAKRRLEGLKLYRPLPLPGMFHACWAKWRVVVGSNRSSKTLSGLAEAARAFTASDPYDKYQKSNGRALMVGLNNDHLSMMWRKLGEPGAFYIIRDERPPYQWRTVRPDPTDPRRLDPYDLAYKEKWREAPPLLPPRFIKSIAWEDFARRIPRKVVAVTGWDSLWRSSDGDAPQGDHYNFVQLDEEMRNTEFYKEASRGLVAIHEPPQHAPRGIWTATSQEGNPELYELCQRGLAGEESVESFLFLVADNPYITPEELATWSRGMTDDDRAVRIYGEFAVLTRQVYREFDPVGVHGCEPFRVPKDYTWFAAVDFGRQHCGTVLLAVDPDEEHIWIVEGFEIRNADAGVWAQELRRRTPPEVCFEAFIGDLRAGRQGAVGTSLSWAEHYTEALRLAGMKPRLTPGKPHMGWFFPGNDNPQAREESLIKALRVRREGPHEGTPSVKIFRGRSPQLERQIRAAHYNDKQVDKRAKVQEDILAALEYGVAFQPYYHPPVAMNPSDYPVWRAWCKKRDRSRPPEEDVFIAKPKVKVFA